MDGQIGQNAYYSLFTSQIEDKFKTANKIALKEGDIISVTAKNSNKTISQTLKSIYYTIKGDDLHIIAASSTGTVAVNGNT